MAKKAHKSSHKKQSTDWMVVMEETFLKLPSLPKNAKQTLVTITPWIALIFGILGLVGGLAGFGVLTVFSPLVAMNTSFVGAAGSLIGSGLGVLASILLLLAFPATKNHSMKGWNLLFWSEACSTIAAVVGFTLSGIIVAAIGFYLLFQIKPYYKK